MSQRPLGYELCWNSCSSRPNVGRMVENVVRPLSMSRSTPKSRHKGRDVATLAHYDAKGMAAASLDCSSRFKNEESFID